MPRTMTRDHPRVGGEKSCSRSIIMRRKGSPPHGRGKEGAQLAEKTGIRITPAWAGKSGSGLLFHRVWWEHPRVGGEKQHFPAVLGIILGSPPHGRGKVLCHDGRRHRTGITPAWAGKSRRAGRCAAASGDHPRVGGEKVMQRDCPLVSGGSPPRGRGKVHQRHNVL